MQVGRHTLAILTETCAGMGARGDSGTRGIEVPDAVPFFPDGGPREYVFVQQITTGSWPPTFL